MPDLRVIGGSDYDPQAAERSALQARINASFERVYRDTEGSDADRRHQALQVTAIMYGKEAGALSEAG